MSSVDAVDDKFCGINANVLCMSTKLSSIVRPESQLESACTEVNIALKACWAVRDRLIGGQLIDASESPLTGHDVPLQARELQCAYHRETAQNSSSLVSARSVC